MNARRWLAIALALSVVAPSLVGSRTAYADPSIADRAAAADLKKKGDDAMDKLDYEGAIAAYAEAWKRASDPTVLYNKGRAHQALAQFPEALAELELFSQKASPALKAKVPKLDALIAEIRAKVSTLVLRCNVKGARILVRERVAPADTPVQLQAGAAVVEASADGYESFRKEVVLPGGSELVVDVTLVSKATTGVLSVASPVAAAEVFVDGKPIGKAPTQVVVPAGTHRVLVRHEGYDEATLSAVVDAGATREVTVSLQKQPPITSRWWFWTGVSVVVVGGAVATYALLTERKPDSGDFSPGQVAGPLVRFAGP